MKLIEVIPGKLTTAATVSTIMEFAQKLGKVPVRIKESPGFIVNRILIPMINEAVMVYQEGIASAEEIDVSMKLGANLPMGPLELADLIGIDVVIAIMETILGEFSDPKYRPAQLLKQMVRAGHLGRKSGQGFYNYTPSKEVHGT